MATKPIVVQGVPATLLLSLYRVRLKNGLWLASSGLGGTASERMAWRAPERAAAVATSLLGLEGASLEICPIVQDDSDPTNSK
jgi:hypothetical protein